MLGVLKHQEIRHHATVVGAVLFVWSLSLSAFADTFTVRLDDGKEVEVDARHAGSGQDAHALEFADGQLQVIPADRLIKRVAGLDPTPISIEEMLTQVETEFGSERILSEMDKPYLIVLVRATTAAPDATTKRVMQNTLKKAGEFFRGMQTNFLQFVKQARVDTTPVKFPLVAVIF
ncbi:MAG: hypothetical protein B7Z55_07225, partial [Planctomycetales bacterium 12-60-4]